jgi:UDP-N-acetylmuramoyl-L-alanyl-D-glutamate--2,6-diaminopimelate ligase
MAAAFYGFPSNKMKVLGLRVQMEKQVLLLCCSGYSGKLGYNAGLISTISYRINDVEETASFTTPDPIKIQQLMSKNG